MNLGVLPDLVTIDFSEVGLLAHPLTWWTRDYTSSDPYPLTYLAWMALPGAYAPASVAFRVTGARRPLHDKAVVLEEGCCRVRF
jgi:hypothetical protein